MPVPLEFTTEITGVDSLVSDLGEAQGAFDDTGTAAEKAGSGGGIGGFVGKLGGIGASAISLVNPVGLAVNAVGFLGPKLLGAGQAANAEKLEMDQLTNTIQNAIPAWDGNTAAIDDAVTAGQAKAFADTELRSTLGQLVTDTGDMAEAQRLQNMAMDLARDKHISLTAAAGLLGKADDKNYAALAKLGIEIPKTATREQALALIHQKTADAADTFAASSEGAAIRASASMDDAMETIGGAVSPLIDMLSNTFANALSDLSPLIGTLASGLSTVLTPAIEIVGGFLSGVSESISFFTQNLQEGMNPLQAVAELIGGVLTNGLQTLGDAFGVPQEAIQGFRDLIWNTIGGLQPIFDGLMSGAQQALGGLSGLFTSAGSGSGVLSSLGDILTTVGNTVGVTASAFMDIAGNVFSAVSDALQTSILPALQNLGSYLGEVMPPIIAGLSAFWTGTLLPAIQQVWGFITSTVIPVAGELVGWLINQIPAALAFLGDAWTNVLMPQIMRVWDAIQVNIIPILQDLIAWLQVNVPVALSTLANFWSTVLQPAITNVWNFLSTSVIPLLGDLVTWLITLIPPALQLLADTWTNILQPAIQNVWNFLDANVLPMLSDLVDWFSTNLPPAIQLLADLWNNTLQPALKTVWEFITVQLLPTLGRLISDGFDRVKAAVQAFASFWNGTLMPAINAVGNAIQKIIDFLADLAAKFGSISLPDWMTPGSPTPWEMGLRGVADAMGDLSGGELPKLQKGMDALNEPALGIGAAGTLGGRGGNTLAPGQAAPQPISLSLTLIQDQKGSWYLSNQSEAQALQMRLETREANI